MRNSLALIYYYHQPTHPTDGVYKAGFAKTQEAYLSAVHPLFESLDKLEVMLTGKDYLVGGRLTEADVRLWVTLVNPSGYQSCTERDSLIGRSRFALIPSMSVTSSATFVLSATATQP